MEYYDPRAPKSFLGQLARKLGMTYVFVWRVFKGRARPSLQTATRMAALAGVPLEGLEAWIALKRAEIWPDTGTNPGTGAGDGGSVV